MPKAHRGLIAHFETSLNQIQPYAYHPFHDSRNLAHQTPAGLLSRHRRHQAATPFDHQRKATARWLI